MKYFTYAALITGTAFAQSITGVPVLKGALKTKTMVRGTQSTCKVKVSSIRNIREEDFYGFPGYKVIIDVNVEGRNENSERVIGIEREFVVTNFWNENGRVVAKDFEYFSEDGANLTIKPDGRLQNFAFNDNGTRITCPLCWAS